MSNRALTLSLTVAVVGVVLGLGGATLAASAGSARPVERPRTLFAGSRRIYAFALGAHRITWVSRTHKRGRYPGCEMYVRTLRTGRTLRAPLPSAGCGVKPPHNFAPQVPALASGVAAWVKGSSCGNTECFWKIATITGGEAKADVVATVDVGCPPPSCGLRHRVGKSASGVPPPYPHPALAGHGNLLVYSTSTAYLDVAQNIDQVRRIVGRRTVRFAVPPGLGDTGGIEGLAVGGGAVEVESTVLDAGDGCGCLNSPAWSPDGSQIAYLHSTPSTVLAVMNADGSARHDLSSTQYANGRPVWSPDGKQLVYGELSAHPEAIAVVNADGSGAHEIGLGANPAWSPDGSKIAFASAGCSATGGSISVMNPDGTNVQPLASFTSNPTCVGGIAWSPDGTRIAFSLNGALEVMDADGGNPHPLTNSEGGDNPSWSPDSSQIAFNTYYGLWVVGADGTGLRQLTQGPDDQPSWSPDGQTIVFRSDRNDPYGYFGENYSRFPELYLVDPDGSNLRPLSFTKPAAFETQTTFYAASGKRLPTFPGVPTLAGKVAAVGSTGPSGGHEITLFNATTGAQLAVVKVGGHAAEFEIAGADSHWIVYRLGPSIYALNAASRKTVRLIRTPARPVGLSVSGRRVAWAENRAGHGRIRAIDLTN